MVRGPHLITVAPHLTNATIQYPFCSLLLLFMYSFVLFRALVVYVSVVTRCPCTIPGYYLDVTLPMFLALQITAHTHTYTPSSMPETERFLGAGKHSWYVPHISSLSFRISPTSTQLLLSSLSVARLRVLVVALGPGGSRFRCCSLPMYHTRLLP